MAVITTTDNNEYLPDGVTPNPNYGQVTTVTVPDPPLRIILLSKTDFESLWTANGSDYTTTMAAWPTG